MITTKEYPLLAGFSQHGILFDKISGTQAVGECPFCGKAGRFYVHVQSLVWDCKVCGKNGNYVGFLTERAKSYTEDFKGDVVLALSKDRGISPRTFRAFGVGWSGSFYSIPVTGNPTRRSTDIHRYRLLETKKRRGFSTSNSHASLITPVELHGSKKVWITEGEWDTMALWECLRKADRKEDVYGVPGAGTFPPKLTEMFYGKDVIVVLDNDAGGNEGAHRISNLLHGCVERIRFIHWPIGLPEKYDLRDLYLGESKDADKTLKFIEKNLADGPVPVSGKDGTPAEADPSTAIDQNGKGMTRDEALAEYRKWLSLPNPEYLDILFGSTFANRLGADPLWLFLVGPPGSCKSELLMSLHEAPLIYTTSSLTPKALVSGANFAGSGDPSLIPKLNKKVLIVKDFTAILQLNSTARDEILGTLRDAYDGETDKDFGNGVVRKYQSRFGIVAGVTNVIEKFGGQSGVLGERFIKYRLRQTGTIDVGRDVIRRALKNITKEGSMRTSLRVTAKQVLNRPVTPEHIPEVTDELADKIQRLAQWIAGLRGVVDRERYTGIVTFKPMQEIGTRLAKQLCTLALGISVWKGEKVISAETYRTIVHVARDTTPDRVEEIIKQLYLRRSHQKSASTRDIATWTRFPEGTVRYILQDLDLLHVVRKDKHSFKGEWMLSKAVLKLMDYLELYKDEEAWSDSVREHKKSTAKTPKKRRKI